MSNQRKDVEDNDKNLIVKISKKNGVKIVTDQQKMKEEKYDKLYEPSSSNVKSVANDETNRTRKKPKLDKAHRIIHDSTSNVASTSSSSVGEQLSATTNGFVDTGSPGKENYSNIIGPPLIADDGGGEIGSIRKKYSSNKNAETILQESRLSPLLSPIHDFPPFEIRNGLPSLMCRLPLTLLTRIPPDPQINKGTNNYQRKIKSDAFALSESDSKSVVDVDVDMDVDIPPPSLSPSPNLFSNGDDCAINLSSHSSLGKIKRDRKRNSSAKSVNTNKKDETCNKDLDDVPISERVKPPKKISTTDKKITEKVNSVTVVETSTLSGSSRLDAKRDAPGTTGTSSSSVEKMYAQI